MQNQIFGITGSLGIGKTYVLQNIITKLKHSGLKIGGYYTYGQESRSFISAYTGDQQPFVDGSKQGITIGRFFISEKAMSFAQRELNRAAVDLIVIDEIGHIEFAQKGLFPYIKEQFATTTTPYLVIIRQDYITKFETVFGSKLTRVWTIKTRNDQDAITTEICTYFLDQSH